MGFNVPTCSGDIGEPLDKCSVNPDISANQPLVIKGEKRDKTLIRREKECELTPETVLVQGQMVRYSDSKG